MPKSQPPRRSAVIADPTPHAQFGRGTRSPLKHTAAPVSDGVPRGSFKAIPLSDCPRCTVMRQACRAHHLAQALERIHELEAAVARLRRKAGRPPPLEAGRVRSATGANRSSS